MSKSMHIRITALAVSAALGALGAACGDLYSDPQPGGGSFDNVSPVGSASAPFFDASALAPKDFVTACPHNPAVEGAQCESIGATCEYGSSPDQHCNTTLSCGPDGNFGTSWNARPSALCPSYECPHGPSTPIDGTPCSLPTRDGGPPTDADELVCPMTDGICACTTGTDPAHAHARVWVCVKPPASCPSTRPLAGQTCGVDGPCDYGSCAFKRGMRMQCNQGVWTSASASCN
ncbi:MAG: hypothetical protein JWO86_6284 [Myxococcaceae bacterium]|nr:hypothetical protein [Myxococcaceae bacterium]MEA2750145.1 hypothetical protein [Myxococcales bacterium]